MKRLLHILLPLLVLFITGCSIDTDNDILSPTPSPDKGITFVLSTSALSPASYVNSLNDVQQYAVSEIDILVFNGSAFKEHATVDKSEITPDPLDHKKKSFNVKFVELKENINYTFVIIANGRALIPSGLTGTDTKDEILEEITITEKNLWVDRSDDSRGIPMWGEVTSTIDNKKITGIKLLRMMAKIDVVENADDFELTKVLLYNYRTGGYVVPASGNYDNSSTKVTAPTIYGERNGYVASPTNNYAQIYPASGNCEDQIFTFETDTLNKLTPAKVDRDSIHCLVIGGKYNNGSESFYRVDFIISDTINKWTPAEYIKTKYRPLLRNHRYTIDIKSVSDNGYGTADEAFKGKVVNMHAEVLEWDESTEMNDVAYDGQYFLAISKTDWEFNKYTQDTTIYIQTNHPGGWSAVASDSWITFPTTGTSASNPVAVNLKLSATSSVREGSITVTAGKITRKINIRQTTNGRITGILVTPKDTVIKVGETGELKATITVDGIADINNITWESDSLAVATVTQEGKVYAHKTGSTKITVRATDGSGVYDTCVVKVISTVKHVVLNKDELYLALGNTKQLIATVLPEDASNKNVTWASSPDSVATVTADGTITAHKEGTTTITVTTEDGGKTATCIVNVIREAIFVTGVKLEKDSTTLAEGSTEELKYQITPPNATNKDVTWSSDNAAVASVDANGIVTTHKKGTATITITTEDGGITDKCIVIVNDTRIGVDSVSIKESTSIVRGSSELLDVTFYPAGATNKRVTWSSANPEIASVDANGLITAHKTGTTTITVTSEDGGKTDNCTVTVTSSVIPVTGVSLKDSTTIHIDHFEKLTPTIIPDIATIKAVKWKSDDPHTVSVASDGTVYGHKVGEAKITVTTVDGNKTADCIVVVLPAGPHVGSIEISPGHKDVYKGRTVYLKATVKPEDAKDKTLTWTSDNPAWATVDQNGKVITKGAGDVIITATANDGSGISGMATITITGGAYMPKPHNGWAGSNIYWDGVKLTFDDTGETANEKYSGVYFQWGSIVGFAPALFANDNFNAASTILYPPEGGISNGNKMGITMWPNTDDTASVKAFPNKFYPIQPVANEPQLDRAHAYEIHDVASKTGDICKHLTDMGWAPGADEGKTWRMPTCHEFNEEFDINTVQKILDNSTNPQPDNPFGRYQVTKGIRSSNGLFLNFGSGRRGITGLAIPEPTSGGNWSSTAWNTYRLGFAIIITFPTGFITGNKPAWDQSYPVRCVQD